MSTKMTLEQRILCVRLYSAYKKPQDIKRAWREKFGKDAPSTKAILAINKKFDSTGSVLTNMSGKGRPKTSTTSENVALVEAAIRLDPKKSVRALAEDLGIPRSSISRIKQEVDKNGNLDTEDIKTLKDKVLALNKKVKILEHELRQRPTSPPSKDNNDDVDVPNVRPMIDNNPTNDPLFIPLEKDGTQSLNSSDAMIHLTPVVSSTENGTQILHVDPETFRLLQEHCSKNVDSKGNH